MNLDVTVVVSVGEEEALGDVWGDNDPLDLGESPLLLGLLEESRRIMMLERRPKSNSPPRSELRFSCLSLPSCDVGASGLLGLLGLLARGERDDDDDDDDNPSFSLSSFVLFGSFDSLFTGLFSFSSP